MRLPACGSPPSSLPALPCPAPVAAKHAAADVRARAEEAADAARERAAHATEAAKEYAGAAREKVGGLPCGVLVGLAGEGGGVALQAPAQHGLCSKVARLLRPPPAASRSPRISAHQAPCPAPRATTDSAPPQAADVASAVGESVSSAVGYIREHLPEVHVERQGERAGSSLRCAGAAHCGLCTRRGGVGHIWAPPRGQQGRAQSGAAAGTPPVPPAQPAPSDHPPTHPPRHTPPQPCPPQTPRPRSARARRCWTRPWRWPPGSRRPSARRRARCALRSPVGCVCTGEPTRIRPQPCEVCAVVGGRLAAPHGLQGLRHVAAPLLASPSLPALPALPAHTAQEPARAAQPRAAPVEERPAAAAPGAAPADRAAPTLAPEATAAGAPPAHWERAYEPRTATEVASRAADRAAELAEEARWVLQPPSFSLTVGQEGYGSGARRLSWRRRRGGC